jgi:putative spermidine/putrescine transport system substrate-binding protein
MRKAPSRALAAVVAALIGSTAAPLSAADGKVVVQYDCIPNYANWGGVTAAYEKKTGVKVPPDMKGSSAAMAALEAEKANPQADVVYYNGAIGYQAATKGLHEPYKPKGWDRIPTDLKDPNGLWWAVHSAHLAILVNTSALKGKPVPRSFADLLKPEYKGMIVYDNPTIHGTGFTFVYGIATILGGAPGDLSKGFDYLAKLKPNLLLVAKENSYNDWIRGEIPIWINADGNGLKAKYVDKAPVEIVIPAEGTVSLPLVMALVKGAPHRAEAEKYLDWCVSDEAQLVMAESYFSPIVPVTFPAKLKGEFLPASAYEKNKVIPLAEMAANADATKQRWLKEIGAN